MPIFFTTYMVSGAHNAKAAQYVLLYPIASGAGQTVQERMKYGGFLDLESRMGWVTGTARA